MQRVRYRVLRKLKSHKANLTWTAIVNLTPTIGMRGQIRRKFIKLLANLTTENKTQAKIISKNKFAAFVTNQKLGCKFEIRV